MQLNFTDEAMAELCNRRDNLLARFGAAVARKIAYRLALLAAAPSLQDVPIGPPVSLLHHDGEEVWSVDLGAGRRLLFQGLLSETAGAVTAITVLDITGPLTVVTKEEALR